MCRIVFIHFRGCPHREVWGVKAVCAYGFDNVKSRCGGLGLPIPKDQTTQDPASHISTTRSICQECYNYYISTIKTGGDNLLKYMKEAYDLYLSIGLHSENQLEIPDPSTDFIARNTTLSMAAWVKQMEILQMSIRVAKEGMLNEASRTFGY
ncbi:hypothetical protein MMC14_004494 [Varicellaria rhodocarpa]|nr:hypothetical protein [Varicellaria rhodocarpa]